MIKVLFTIPNFDTAGSGKALLNIATRLDRTRFEPEILCKHNKGEFFKTVLSSGLKVHVFDYETPMRPILKGFLGCFRVSRRLKRIKPDIVHSFHYSADYSEPLSCFMAGIKWIYTKKNMNWGGGSKNAWILRTKLAKHVIIQNTDMFRFFDNHKKLTLVPRGVNKDEFQPISPEKKLELKKKLGLDNKFKYIICVANLVPVKGVETLINAYTRLKTSDYKLLIVGDNTSDYGQGLVDFVNQNALNNSIYFTGKVQNVKDYLGVSDIFVLPTKSKGEGSPVSLLEAMSSGLLVLGSKIPGIKDQLSKFPELMFETGKVIELQSKLEELMLNSNSKRLKEKLRATVENNYSIMHEVKRHEAVYEGIFSKHR